LNYDPVSNTVIAEGENITTGSNIMMSRDGGEHWFEIGYIRDDVFRTDYNWDGIYNWSDSIIFYPLGGMVCGYGWWFVINSDITIGENIPSLVRISFDGKISEMIYLPLHTAMRSVVMVAGYIFFQRW
jgi:hypothetical protein